MANEEFVRWMFEVSEHEQKLLYQNELNDDERDLFRGLWPEMVPPEFADELPEWAM